MLLWIWLTCSLNAKLSLLGSQGKINCADSLTKFLPDPIGICNSEEWRLGYHFMRTVENNRANTYLTVSSSGIKYFGISDEITKTEKNAQRLKAATVGENFV